MVFGPEAVLLTRGFRGMGAIGASYAEALRTAVKLASRPPYIYIGRFVAAGSLRSIVVTGDDPVLEVVAGRGNVVYIYGSPWRLRCRLCGYTLHLSPRDKLPDRCPRCGGPLEPEAGDKPLKRMLERALSEVTTASPLIVGGFREPTYLELALVAATVRLGVEVYCDNTIPDWMPCKRLGTSIEEFLGLASASHHTLKNRRL